MSCAELKIIKVGPEAWHLSKNKRQPLFRVICWVVIIGSRAVLKTVGPEMGFRVRVPDPALNNKEVYMKTVFIKKRITSSNIQSYMAEMYPELFIKNVESKIISPVPALLQKEYGEANDCTLTSLTAILMLLKKEADANKIYPVVEKIAKKYGYTGSTGTNPLFIKKIFDNSLKSFSLVRTTRAKYLKGGGYNFALIKQLINAGKPIVLSMSTDGRGFYVNHSVLVVGYREYLLTNSSAKKVKRFLTVQDNWTKEKSFIDYDKLSTISSVNY